MFDPNRELFVERLRFFQEIDYFEPGAALLLGHPSLQEVPAPYAIWFTDGAPEMEHGGAAIQVVGASYAFCVSYSTKPYSPAHIEAVKQGRAGKLPVFTTSWDPLYLGCNPSRFSTSAERALMTAAQLIPTLVLSYVLDRLGESFATLATQNEMRQDEIGWLTAAEQYLAGRVIVLTENDLREMREYRPGTKPPQAGS